MRHFTLEKWADFARDVVGEEEKAQMQTHLKSGCKECGKVAGVWKRIYEAARRENSYNPPDSAVRTVKGQGVIHGVGQDRATKPKFADLLFDSFRSPAMAGVRSVSAAARQLLFGAGEYRLDIRIEPNIDSEKVSLLGQILNSSKPNEGVGEASVTLLRGQTVLAESATNQFGEFHLECDLETSLQLRAKLPHGAVVWIPLVEPAGDKSGEGPDLSDSIGVKKILRAVKKRAKKKV
ncbi:MAG: hypothetical protein WBP79_02630 [Candidatus Acidiferrales bacterium]